MEVKVDDLVQAVQSADSYRKVGVILGYNHNLIKKWCEESNIDTSHFKMNFVGDNRVGQKYFGLTIISLDKTKNKRRIYAECICECGSFCNKRLDAVINGKIRYCSHNCTRLHNNTLGVGSTNPCFRGIGKVGSCFFANIKRGASRRNIEFKITLDYISKLYDLQKGKCALSGLNIEFGKIRTSGTTASLDRIDSTKGYIEGNVQWVHKLVNRMKMDITQEVFLEICDKVTTYRKQKI